MAIAQVVPAAPIGALCAAITLVRRAQYLLAEIAHQS